ncbi:hypothetical protein FAZ15_12585 [Sphingobacterium olei]|uniref:FAS1 domain-containing protein n=1 Tax=Sphingobacterium olei TaxID=2571155 RepID=A0A4U0PAL9_9SPHI|nr:hypothetical protein [Sphingobacterium olei]TJZ59734.1 hypothetical protein FAZ15_12585 [Sphingobacterium olei]
MKYISFLLFTLGISGMLSCQKGDSHYYDYQKAEQLYNGSIYSYLINQKGTYDSLALVLERLPDLKEKLNQTNNDITLFAVNNRSFALAVENLNVARKQNGLPPLYLEDIKLDVLDTLAQRYVFDERYPVSDFESYLDGQSIFSTKYDYEMHVLYKVLTSSGLVNGGQQQLMFSDVNESIYQRYWNSTTTATVDFKTENGIIHTLTARHEFGFGKLTAYLSKN